MKTINVLKILAVAGMFPGIMAAQSVADEPVVTVIVGDPAAAEDVEIEFMENAPAKKRDNGLPRFAIVGKDRKFYLGIGAQFQGEGVLDFGDEMPSAVDFIPSSIVPKTPGNGASLRFSALTSSIYLNAVALPGTKDRVGLFFKGKIHNGDAYGFTVSHFYVTYRGFMAGYTSSFFADGAAMPYTIDNQGPNGSADVTLFTAGYTHDFTSHLSGAIGIDAPSIDMTAGRETATVSQRSPAIPLYLQYGWGGESHVRLSGIVRPLQYRDLVAEKNRTPVGWGVQLSGVAEVSPLLTLYYDATYGRGIANYLQDNTDLGLDMTPSLETPGKSKLMESLGLTGGLTLNLSPKVAVNAVYSHVSNWTGKGASLNGDQYRYGDYVAANVIYTLNKIVAMGIEYDYGHRKAFDSSSLHASRIQAQLAVTF